MAHLNLYLPDDVANRLKHEATSANLPLSRYVVNLLTGAGGRAAWPEGYFKNVCGFLNEEMEEPLDLPPNPVEPLSPESLERVS